MQKPFRLSFAAFAAKPGLYGLKALTCLKLAKHKQAKNPENDAEVRQQVRRARAAGERPVNG